MVQDMQHYVDSARKSLRMKSDLTAEQLDLWIEYDLSVRMGAMAWHTECLQDFCNTQAQRIDKLEAYVALLEGSAEKILGKLKAEGFIQPAGIAKASEGSANQDDALSS